MIKNQIMIVDSSTFNPVSLEKTVTEIKWFKPKNATTKVRFPSFKANIQQLHWKLYLC